MGWVYIDGYFKSYYVKCSPLWFGRLQNLSERVDASTMGFSGKQHLKQNVNIPGYTLASAAPTPSYKTQITALQADSSRFLGVVIKMNTESITSQK